MKKTISDKIGISAVILYLLLAAISTLFLASAGGGIPIYAILIGFGLFVVPAKTMSLRLISIPMILFSLAFLLADHYKSLEKERQFTEMRVRASMGDKAP